MRKILPLLIAAILVPAIASAIEVPLGKLTFAPAPEMRSGPVTLVVPSELAGLIDKQKIGYLKLEFPIGAAVSAATEGGLRSAYQNVVVTDVAPETVEGTVITLKAMTVKPKLPKTVFGTFSSTVTLTYLVRMTSGETEVTLEAKGDDKKNAAVAFYSAKYSRPEAAQTAKATDEAIFDAIGQLLAKLKE